MFFDNDGMFTVLTFKQGVKIPITTNLHHLLFEKMSRQKKDEDIVDYFTAIFSQCDDPQRMWIG